MPKKTEVKESVTPIPVRAAKPKAAAATRVKTVKHSKAAPVAVPEGVESIESVIPETPTAENLEIVPVNAHDKIALIAWGYWAARGFQPGSPEQDWLRAEQEFLLSS